MGRQVPPTIAVDPGVGTSDSSGTGIVAVNRTSVVTWCLCRQQEREDVDTFARRVVDVVHHIRDAHGDWTVVVEDVTPPTGFAKGKRAPINPGSLIGLATVAGVVAYEFDAKRVRPSGHGSAHQGHPGISVDDIYPDELCGRRKKPLGDMDDGGGGQHLRSAWDVAYAAWSPMR